MAISPSFLINKSGVVVPVYQSISGNITVGQLEKREAYSMYGYEGGITSITFLGPSGSLISGFLHDPPTGTTTPCINYPYGTVVINNTTYYTFYMRSTKNVYTKQGNYWGKVAGGRRVACLSSLAGETHQNYKGINYVENTSGEWIKVEGNNYSYGFVDTGLQNASSYSKIAMYGSW